MSGGRYQQYKKQRSTQKLQFDKDQKQFREQWKLGKHTPVADVRAEVWRRWTGAQSHDEKLYQFSSILYNIRMNLTDEFKMPCDVENVAGGEFVGFLRYVRLTMVVVVKNTDV